MVSFRSLAVMAIAFISTALSGSVQTLNGVSCYVATPPLGVAFYGSNLKALLFITDVYGYATANATQLADAYALAGYLVVMPDLFNGDAWNSTRDIAGLPAWGAQYSSTVIDPLLAGVLTAMKTKWNPKKVGATGYCFGGKYVFRLLGTGQVSVGVAAHPSMTNVGEIGGVQGPIQISSAAVDASFSIDYRRQVEDTLIAGNKQYQLNIFSGVAHGYGVNGDISKPAVKYAKETTFLNAVAWFKGWL